MNTIGDKIKAIRLDKDMSLRQFAELVDLSHTNISRFEKGFDSKGDVKGSIQIDTLKQICDNAGYPLQQFLEETGYIDPIAVPAVAPSLSPLQQFCGKLAPHEQTIALENLMLIFPHVGVEATTVQK